MGVAIVALMAACGGKTETTTETAAEAPVVETPAEEDLDSSEILDIDENLEEKSEDDGND